MCLLLLFSLRLYGFTYFYKAVTMADFKNSVHSGKICTVLFWIFDLQALSETRSAQTVGKVPVFILQRTVRFFTNALKCFLKSATVTAFLKKSEAIQPSGRRSFRIYVIIRVMPGFFPTLKQLFA